jgi:hypothetical protein
MNINKLNKNIPIYTLLALKPRIQDMYNYSYNETPMNEYDFVNGKVVNFTNTKYKLYYKELIDDYTHWHRITFDIKESDTQTRWLMHFIA